MAGQVGHIERFTDHFLNFSSVEDLYLDSMKGHDFLGPIKGVAVLVPNGTKLARFRVPIVREDVV